MSASSCEELAEAMALWIALALDPNAASRSDARGAPEASPAARSVVEEPAIALPRPAKPSVSASVIVPAATARSAPGSAPGSTLAVELAALAALEVGRLPGVAPGALVDGALSWRRLVLGVELGWFPAQHTAQQNAGGNVSLSKAAARVGYCCFDGLLAPFLGLELDRVHGVGTDLETSRSGDLWLLALDVGLRVRYPVQRPLKLIAQCEGSALVERGRFYIEPNTELFRPARLGFQCGFGAELRLR